jgi:hypothetical protein
MRVSVSQDDRSDPGDDAGDVGKKARVEGVCVGWLS